MSGLFAVLLGVPIANYQVLGFLCVIAALLVGVRLSTPRRASRRSKRGAEMSQSLPWRRIRLEVKRRNFSAPTVGIGDPVRDVQLFPVNADRHPETPRKRSLFCLVHKGRNYPVFCFDPQREMGVVEDRPVEFLTHNIENDLQDPFWAVGWPPEGYPIAPIASEDERAQLIEFALEALCFYGFAGDGISGLPKQVWCAEWGGMRRTIMDYI